MQNVQGPPLGGTTLMVVSVNGTPGVVQCTTFMAIHSSPAIRHTTNLVLFIYEFAASSPCLEQCQACRRHSVNICRMNEWISVPLNQAACWQLSLGVKEEEPCVLMDDCEDSTLGTGRSPMQWPLAFARTLPQMLGSPEDSMLSSLSPFKRKLILLLRRVVLLYPLPVL